MSDRAAIFYYVARIVDGQADIVDLRDRVITFSYVDREGGLDKLTLTVDNKDLANFDDPLFEYGGKLRVAWGNGRSSSAVRDMVIKKVTGGRELTVVCAGKEGAALDTVKKRRRFEQVRRSDVVRQIARENGFRNPDIEETPEMFGSIAQSNLTDGQFLRKLAALEGFEFYVDFDGLHWHRRRVDQAPIRAYRYFNDPEGGEIVDFNVTNDVTRKPGKVSVKSRDPLAKTDINAEASNDTDTDRSTLATRAVAIDGEGGKLIDRSETAYEDTVASNVQTEEDAVREAKGRYRKTQQVAVKLDLELRGDPSLVAKTVIQVEGLGTRLSGKYYVKEVTHNLDAGSGYSMSVKCITDGFQGGAGRGTGQTSNDSGAALVSAADELFAAGIADISSGIDGESGALTGDLAKLQALQGRTQALSQALKALAGQQGPEQASNAARAAQALTRVASAARSAGAANTAASAANAAALCRRLATAPEAIETKGRPNDKTVDDSSVRPVKTVDADGRPVTRYDKTGGRES